MTYPSIYPTGTTIYNPAKCWNGYTVYQIKLVYRAYRVPYEWAPQLDPPEEVGIEPMDPTPL